MQSCKPSVFGFARLAAATDRLSSDWRLTLIAHLPLYLVSTFSSYSKLCDEEVCSESALTLIAEIAYCKMVSIVKI
jgi:hypothetical protein